MSTPAWLCTRDAFKELLTIEGSRTRGLALFLILLEEALHLGKFHNPFLMTSQLMKHYNRTRVQGWQDIPNDNQKWSFERVSRTPTEIQAVLTANPRTASTQFKHYADANYLLLPKRVRDAIYTASGIRNNFRWRSEVFDCRAPHASLLYRWS